jgi:hypothetical protein
MATRSKSYASRVTSADIDGEAEEPRVTRRRIAAVVAGAGGWVTTWLCVEAIGLKGVLGLVVASVIEWLLFEFKREVLSGDRRGSVPGIVAIAVDTVLNGGGMWSVVLNLDDTQSYRMFATSLSLDGKMNPLPALAISLGLGFILAIAPHLLWHGRRPRG